MRVVAASKTDVFFRSLLQNFSIGIVVDVVWWIVRKNICENICRQFEDGSKKYRHGENLWSEKKERRNQRHSTGTRIKFLLQAAKRLSLCSSLFYSLFCNHGFSSVRRASDCTMDLRVDRDSLVKSEIWNLEFQSPNIFRKISWFRKIIRKFIPICLISSKAVFPILTNLTNRPTFYKAH